jgi:hypothetical protein
MVMVSKKTRDEIRKSNPMLASYLDEVANPYVPPPQQASTPQPLRAPAPTIVDIMYDFIKVLQAIELARQPVQAVDDDTIDGEYTITNSGR